MQPDKCHLVCRCNDCLSNYLNSPVLIMEKESSVIMRLYLCTWLISTGLQINTLTIVLADKSDIQSFFHIAYLDLGVRKSFFPINIQIRTSATSPVSVTSQKERILGREEPTMLVITGPLYISLYQHRHLRTSLSSPVSVWSGPTKFHVNRNCVNRQFVTNF